MVSEHGAVVIRGLGLSDVSETSEIFAGLGGRLMADREAISARLSHSRGVYSSKRWLLHRPMCLHHERSYALEFPAVMMFACLTAPCGGGAALLADSACVLESIPAAIVERFEREGWILTRDYHAGLGASLEESFSTDNHTAIESYCRANAIECEWRADGGLRTRQHRPAVVNHPVTGRRCWFNQIAFLSEWMLDPEVHDYLVELHGPEGLPFNTYFGDGEPVSAEIVAAINAAYEHNTVSVPWRAGDLMLIDNIGTGHGRAPYKGTREVLEAMVAPTHADLLTHRAPSHVAMHRSDSIGHAKPEQDPQRTGRSTERPIRRDGARR
jgi:alpha-ketoglutarate-dependent taurine dioxygenase